MKNLNIKFIFYIPLLLFSFQSEAQFLVGGKISYADINFNNFDSKSKTKNYLFSPEIGFTIKPNILFGFRYSFSSNKNDDEIRLEKETLNAYSIFNRYRKPLNKKLNLYGEFSFTYSILERYNLTILSGLNNLRTFHTYQISIGPGIEFKIAPKWLLNAQWGIISYTNTKIVYREEEEEEEKSKALLVELDPSNISIGLSYLFNLKEKE